MEILTILSDIVIVFLSIWILLKLKGYGGLIGESLARVGYGTVIIGLSQIIETIRLDYLRIDLPTLEIVHHLIFILGLVLIAIGFKRLMEGK